ncbi:MAG: hypothetical protein L3J69_04600 [Desulfobacula sp.]|nr:hypothetical protein [Desulfobacula sp.]
MLHPSMALRYQKAITGLRESLKSGKAAGAKEHIRALIEKIVLTPKENRKELSIDLYGNLAGILKIASEDKFMKNMTQKTKRIEKKVANDNFIFEPSVQVVAGAGYQR